MLPLINRVSRRMALTGAATLLLASDASAAERRGGTATTFMDTLGIVSRQAEIAQTHFPSSIDYILNLGLSEGLRNGALYRRVKSESYQHGQEVRADRWLVRDASGAIFELDEDEVAPELWGADPTGRVDSTRALQTALDYAQFKRVPVVLRPGGLYQFDTLEMRRQAVIVGAMQNSISVHSLVSTKELMMPTLRSSGKDATSILFPAAAWSAGITGVAIDLSAKSGSADGIVFEGGSGSSSGRAGHWLRDVIVFGGTGKLVSIQRGNSGGTIERCWFRGGATSETSTVDYVLHNEGLDWRFIGPLNLSGARTAVLYEAGGASRYQAVDCFMGQKVGVVVSGQSATFERLQSDLHGGAALEVRGARNLTLIAFKAQNSGSVDRGALVRFFDGHAGCVMIAPIVMAGHSSGTVAFSQEGQGAVQIDGARVSKRLLPFDARAQGQWKIRDAVIV